MHEKTNCFIFAAAFKNADGGLAQLARAFDWQSRGHRFDSDILHKNKKAFTFYCVNAFFFEFCNSEIILLHLNLTKPGWILKFLNKNIKNLCEKCFLLLEKLQKTYELMSDINLL